MKTNKKVAKNVTVDAFSRLYEEFAPRVFGYLVRRTPTVMDAEELTSTVFLRAFTALANFRGRGSDAQEGAGAARSPRASHCDGLLRRVRGTHLAAL